VWIIDGTTLRLVSVEDAGRGPTGIVASARHKKIYVGNYAEDTITVIDAAPGSTTQNRAVLRLGEPRPLEGN
jgi:DNA-binding beta-propeller fold protein YncE